MKEELGHTFGSDSTFWISYEDLLRKYQHFDRTRLFRDNDWRSCQRWIGVEVPWKPQYNEKFHIKLAKESPLVLVLSQLDTRYFKGLQGQYNFRLQFRLHEEGRPGAEEYIVRSHGNYLMDRSVSVELPSVGPGNYIVFISIIGERDTRVLSTEDVIKREAKGREENEKLAQVGQAYDLAHSKATSHLERLSKVRKKAEGKKASESRRKERRKNWEKRQIGRDIAVKQKAKDEAKKARLRAKKTAKADAAAKEKADREAAEKAAADKKAAEEKAAAERAAEEERLQQQAESKPKDSSVQTDSKAFKEEGSQTEMEADSASTTSSSSSSGTPQYTPQDSPSSQAAQPVENNKEKVSVPPPSQSSIMSGGPPPSPRPQPPIELKVHCCPCDCSCKKPPPKAEETDYSSDSPVEDYENLYDEDDLTPTLRLANSPVTPATGTTNNSPDSEDEDVPDPWNAIAVIGFRVYSKDEDLELRVIMEGGALEQDGMGSLGEADLDNAVSNAAGQRSRNNDNKQGEEQISEKKDGADQGKSSSAERQQEPNKKEVPELRVTTAAQDVASSSDPKQGKSSSPHEAKSAPVAGMAAYRTIIERKTSEFDRVMGKVKAQQSAAAAAATTTTSSALAKLVTAEQPPPVPQVGDNKAAPAVDGYFSDSHDTPQSPESPLERKTREVLFIRHKIQRGFLAPDQEDCGLPDGQMAELSDLLTQLEKLDDLEAQVISATKINKVMRALIKNDLPRDKELSIRSRAYALLDEYELTLLVGDDDDDYKASTLAGKPANKEKPAEQEKDATASANKE